MSVRVLLADPHTVVRQGTRTLLERANLLVVGETSDGDEALALVRHLRPDVAILALSPGFDALGLARRIASLVSGTGVLLLTMDDTSNALALGLRAGVRGAVDKTDSSDELVRAIRDVARGDVHLSPTILQRIAGAVRRHAGRRPTG